MSNNIKNLLSQKNNAYLILAFIAVITIAECYGLVAPLLRSGAGFKVERSLMMFAFISLTPAFFVGISVAFLRKYQWPQRVIIGAVISSLVGTVGSVLFLHAFFAVSEEMLNGPHGWWVQFWPFMLASVAGISALVALAQRRLSQKVMQIASALSLLTVAVATVVSFLPSFKTLYDNVGARSNIHEYINIWPLFIVIILGVTLAIRRRSSDLPKAITAWVVLELGFHAVITTLIMRFM